MTERVFSRSSVSPCTGGVLQGCNIKRGGLMTRTVLAGLVLLNCTAFATELFAQAGQTVNPVPITPPTLNTTTLTCQINCDTQAMNCQNSCVPTTGAVAAPQLAISAARLSSLSASSDAES
jgi:hypothetical protein